MTFQTEQELEAHLRHIVASEITAQYPYIYALQSKKAVDIVICRDGEHPAIFFVEVKLFKAEHGRLGIGTGGGGGYQPEIVARDPVCFRDQLRWVIVDGRKAMPSFLFISTSTVRQYLSGGRIGEKFNNIQVKIFSEVPALDESALTLELLKWLSQ